MKLKRILAAVCAAGVALCLAGCGNSDTDKLLESLTAGTSKPASSSTKKPTSVSTSSKPESKPVISEPTVESEPAEVSEPTSGSASEHTSIPTIVDPNLLRPEVKEAIDSYEDFIDEYCDFLKKMSETDNVGIMMMEYMEYTYKLTEMGEKFDKISDDDLTDAERNYYLEVMLRCNQKMLNSMS